MQMYDWPTVPCFPVSFIQETKIISIAYFNHLFSSFFNEMEHIFFSFSVPHSSVNSFNHNGFETLQETALSVQGTASHCMGHLVSAGDNFSVQGTSRQCGGTAS